MGGKLWQLMQGATSGSPIVQDRERVAPQGSGSGRPRATARPPRPATLLETAGVMVVVALIVAFSLGKSGGFPCSASAGAAAASGGTAADGQPDGDAPTWAGFAVAPAPEAH